MYWWDHDCGAFFSLLRRYGTIIIIIINNLLEFVIFYYLSDGEVVLVHVPLVALCSLLKRQFF